MAALNGYDALPKCARHSSRCIATVISFAGKEKSRSQRLKKSNKRLEFNHLSANRRLVYRCIESMLKLDNKEEFLHPLILLYDAETFRQAEALLDRSESFFGLDTLGADMQGSAIH